VRVHSIKRPACNNVDENRPGQYYVANMSSKMFSTTLLQAGSFLQCTQDNLRCFAEKTSGILQRKPAVFCRENQRYFAEKTRLL
jgi:hypothetical protein